jgi:hypothetical protein
MDREKANGIRKAYGRPSITTTSGTTLVFARQEQSDIECIEQMETKELIEQWKALTWMNYIYGQVSLNDMQRIDLLELEMDERKIEEDLKAWYDKKEKEFNESEEMQ